jgi:chaperonin subunit
MTVKVDRLRACFYPDAQATSPKGGRTMARFRPLHDRVLLRRVEAEEKTPGGIIIPDTA